MATDGREAITAFGQSMGRYLSEEHEAVTKRTSQLKHFIDSCSQFIVWDQVGNQKCLLSCYCNTSASRYQEGKHRKSHELGCVVTGRRCEFPVKELNR